MLKATIDRFEGDFAILSLEDGQKLNWPKEKLPKNIKEGAVLWLSILEDKEATQKQRELAKEILNEILRE
jgi:uncharacterized protein (DUF2225 family)